MQTKKCKAKWIKSIRSYQLHCRECNIYAWHVTPKEGHDYVLPHDMAVTHVQRYHKG